MRDEKYCCPECFDNRFIIEYIDNEYEDIGDCFFCNSHNVKLISTKTLGIYMRDCISKAFEWYDVGTGAYYDDEDKQYCGPDGEQAEQYSVREILMDEEAVFNDKVIDTNLIDDLFENLYSVRDIQHGAEDPFDDIDSANWVYQNDLYGYEHIKVYYAWEGFKHVIKHYNRFFDSDGYKLREECLELIKPYIYDFVRDIPSGTKLYRTRKVDESLVFDELEPYSEMGPPPAYRATTNRMSPAGIPYLYLSSDIDTTLDECRIMQDEKVITAEYITKEELQILDFSKNTYFSSDSIFDPEFDQDNRWINEFWHSFIREISEPISEEKNDHSYEYTATQLIAEYFRTKHYDGICFKSSVGWGDNYVFFYGPDPEYKTDAYPSPYGNIYFNNSFPIIDPFTDMFQISKIYEIVREKQGYEVLKTRDINEL